MWPLVGMALKATTCLTGFSSLSNGAFKVDWLRCLTLSAGKGHLGNRPFPSFQNPHVRIWMSFRDKVRNLVPGPLFFRPLYKEKGKTDTQNEAVIAWSSAPTQRWKRDLAIHLGLQATTTATNERESEKNNSSCESLVLMTFRCRHQTMTC